MIDLRHINKNEISRLSLLREKLKLDLFFYLLSDIVIICYNGHCYFIIYLY